MTNACVIPARGGSKRIPRKNIRLFHGKPIIVYSIEAAADSKLFDAIIVSTDDDEIEAIVKPYGVRVHRRPPDDGTRGTQAVTLEALEACKMHPEYVCCVYATAPMMSPHDINHGLYTLTHTSALHCVSVLASPLADAAQFYWSQAHRFGMWPDYWKSTTVGLAIDPRRVCDINVEDDWLRAECMYAELRGMTTT